MKRCDKKDLGRRLQRIGIPVEKWNRGDGGGMEGRQSEGLRDPGQREGSALRPTHHEGAG